LESLTGLTGFYWLLFFCYALALVLVVESWRREPEGERVGGLLAVPLVAGAMLAAFLVLAYRPETRHLLAHITDRRASIPVAVVELVAAVAFVDLFFARFTALTERALARLQLSRKNRADIALIVGVGVPAVIALLLMPRAHKHFLSKGETARAAPQKVEPTSFTADYRIPGQPLDLVLLSPTLGYVSFDRGTIAKVELPTSAGVEPTATTVAAGLQFPRGLAIVDDTLLVAELGPLPCKPAYPSCKGGDIKGESVDDTERKILRTSRARVLAFDIDDDNGLSNRRVILRDLPVANTDHGLNDMIRGPDGRIYLTIGNLDAIYSSSKLKRDLIRPHVALLGTVVSFEPDGTDLRVFAKGLRNVYGLAFDPRGQLYGSDNSGPTRKGYQNEELIRIERGADYGYPAVARRKSTPPTLRFLPTAGSGGITWIGDSTTTGGRLLLGSCAGMHTVPLVLGDDGEPRVPRSAKVKLVQSLPGCVTAIKERPGGLVVTLFTAGPRGKLYFLPPYAGAGG
jgi:hypothetical protein